MTNHPNRDRGRPRDPNAKVHLTMRVRPDLFQRITAREDWRAVVEAELDRRHHVGGPFIIRTAH